MLRFVVCLAVLGGCFPYAIPPLRGEVGAVAQSKQPTAGRVSGGAHLASGTLRHDQPFDVGAGAFYEWDDNGERAKGAYADAAVFIDRGARTRTSLGIRGEVRHDPTMGYGTAAKLRIDHEIYKKALGEYSGHDRCGVIFGGARGTGAAGIYVEAGPAFLPGDQRAFVATVGVTLRIPATLGLLVGIPGCK